MTATITRIGDLADAYVTCRAIGHAWDDNPTAEVDSDLFRASRGALLLRCTRCTTERFDYLAQDMSVFQRYYRYPDGYRVGRGATAGGRPQLRAEMFNRSLLIRRRTGRLKAVS